MTQEYKPKKLKLIHEQNQEQIQETFDILFDQLTELQEHVVYLSELNSLILNMLTVSNRLLMAKGIISNEEYERQLTKIKEETTEFKTNLDKQKEFLEQYNNIMEPVIDNYDDKIFDDYDEIGEA